ncbi:MAG: LysM peptidoglycan-binding domain-containing protein [Thermodesulfovibrio sp.]|nr:LysM peptidoglycan-binding domain-containing protein [Thermodesulfovibrio sp.]MDW7972938.1 LysM peptidoglycan-binding domain-containing protein [Thermodesulfovibrio sp.]
MFKNLFIIFLIIVILPFLAFAESYVVKKGDNIWKISKKFNVTVEDIKKANNLRNNKLKVGMELVIPTKNKIAKQNKKIKKEDYQFYTVKKGDTLYRIAKKYNISVEDLKSLNNLTENNLKIGQKLIVKAPKKKDVPLVASSNSALNDKIEDIEDIKSEDLTQLSIKERVLLFAKKMLHLPYKFGGNSYYGLDCSFFVKKVYSMVGIELPRSAREQFNVGIPISKEELQPGDLVFFRTYAKFPSHVGIYLGDSLFIHASTRSKKVTIDSLETPYYLQRFIGAKRIPDLNKDLIEETIKEIMLKENQN